MSRFRDESRDATDTAVSRRHTLKALGGALAAPSVTDSFESPSEGSSAGEPVALQYFHEDWATITDDLARVADRGYDAIWIQQPAKHKLDWDDVDGRNDPPLGYQPIDLRTFDSAFGTEAELETLIETAHEHGVDVIVDTVMNHMAAGRDPKYEFPQFDYDDFHHVAEPDEETKELLGLPDLKQESEYVRGELKAYVNKIAALGADGYRFDAVKHMPEWFFAEYANRWAEDNDMFRVGEVWEGSVSYLEGYVEAGPGMSAFDYPLQVVLEDVFEYGDMRRLQGAGLVAKHPFRAMPFVENHDVQAPSQYKLAHAFVLTIEGYPMVYNLYPDWILSDADITNMVWVKSNLAGGPTTWRHVDSDVLVYEREGNLLVGLNNAESSRTVTVETSWTNETLNDYAGNADDVQTDGAGSVELSVPAGGWTFYAPAGGSDPAPSPPTAAFDYAPSDPDPGESVSFDASESSDVDGDLASYAWDFDGDGSTDATGVTAEWTFSEAGDYDVTLTVSDESSETRDDEATRTVEVAPPEAVVDEYDVDGDGCIDVDELNAAIEDHGRGELSAAELDAVIEVYLECLG